MTEEFLAHQQGVGNDLSTPRPEWGFPGLVPGDRWCVVAVRWVQAYQDGAVAPVVLASTNERALEVVPDVVAAPARGRRTCGPRLADLTGQAGSSVTGSPGAA